MKVAGIEVGDRPLILAPMEDVTTCAASAYDNS